MRLGHVRFSALWEDCKRSQGAPFNVILLLLPLLVIIILLLILLPPLLIFNFFFFWRGGGGGGRGTQCCLSLSHTHTLSHTCINACTHARARTHTHTHHTLSLSLSPECDLFLVGACKILCLPWILYFCLIWYKNALWFPKCCCTLQWFVKVVVSLSWFFIYILGFLFLFLFAKHSYNF